MKGSVFDILYIVIILFLLALGFIFTSYTGGMMLSTMNTTEFTNTQGVNATITAVDQGLDGLDLMFILVAFGLILGLIITAYLIPTPPVMVFVFILLAAIVLFVSPTITNVFGSVVEAPEINATANSFPYTITFFENLPLIVLALFVILTVVMLAKPYLGV